MNDANASAGGKILVVDDEPSIVDAVATALRYEGFEVREELTGRAALTAIAEFEPDLVVLDWMLPDVEGSRSGGACASAASARRSSSSRRKTPSRTRSRRCGPAATTTSRSRSASPRSSRACRRSCGGRASELPGDVLRFADVALDESRHEVSPRRDARRADRDRVRAAPLLPAQPAPRPLEGADPPERLALRLRRQLERRRDVRQLPPQEARRARPAADPHGAAGRLHARTPGRVMRRLSLRARLLLGVVALAAVGLVVADVVTYGAPALVPLSTADSTLQNEHQAFEGQRGDGGRTAAGRRTRGARGRRADGTYTGARRRAVPGSSDALAAGPPVDDRRPRAGQRRHRPRQLLHRRISEGRRAVSGARLDRA